jgi:hypothetical protein
MNLDQKLEHTAHQVVVANINAHIAVVAASQVLMRGRREGWVTDADLQPILDAIDGFRQQIVSQLPARERDSFEKVARLFEE